MAETSYERGYREGTSGVPIGSGTTSRGTNPLTKKLGPLPVWAWAALALLLVLGYLYYKNRKNSTSNTTSSGTTTTSDSQIPQFVNQVYTNGTPPSDGNTGPSNPTNPTPTNQPSNPINPSPQGLGNANLVPITQGQATTLLGKKQRPYMWNGTNFVAATKIQKGVQYYAGPLENEEILSKTGPFTAHPIAKKAA